MKLKQIFQFTVVVATLATSCKKNLLDVPNTNNPDYKKVYASSEDVKNVTSGLYNTIFQAEHNARGVEAMLATAADHASCSWGNFGMRDMSYEPRNNGWNNSPTYGNKTQTKYTFDQLYSAINTASLVIKSLDKGLKIDGGAGDNMVRAVAKFAQGVGYGDLALFFDKAFLVDENKTVEESINSAIDYKKIAEAAISYLDTAIMLSNSAFTIPSAWLGTDHDISNSEFKKICNTYAARILSYVPRNKADLEAVNWNKVKTYADNGINTDFLINMDGTTKWYFESGDYLTNISWAITDMYVVHMMDPEKQPQHWDDSPNFPYPAESTNPIDKRLFSDFEYLSSNSFQPARGYYHFSSYRFKRYDDIYVNAVGLKAAIMKTENDMLKAEARAYLSELGAAAEIINNGTRKTRGQMQSVNATLLDIIKAIHHERHVEMYTTGTGIQFFEMRKLNLLQKGTPLHLPLPADVLQLFGLTEFYTFGYLANADGKGTSNGGWR